MTYQPPLEDSWWTHRMSNVWHGQLTSAPPGDPAGVALCLLTAHNWPLLLCRWRTSWGRSAMTSCKSWNSIWSPLQLVESPGFSTTKCMWRRCFLLFSSWVLSAGVAARCHLPHSSLKTLSARFFLGASCKVECARVLKMRDSRDQLASCCGNRLHRKRFSRLSLTHCIALYCLYLTRVSRTKKVLTNCWALIRKPEPSAKSLSLHCCQGLSRLLFTWLSAAKTVDALCWYLDCWLFKSKRGRRREGDNEIPTFLVAIFSFQLNIYPA